VPEEFLVVAASHSGDIDDRTVAYILESKKAFEDLRHIASQLAGLLVLAAAGGKAAAPDHPMFEAAQRLHASVSDALRLARPTQRALSHHSHLIKACDAVGLALSVAESNLAPPRDEFKINRILVPLQAAYAELRLASHELPGFEMISFEQGCCGAAQSHAAHAQQASADRTINA
jgi:hypothetical protein